MPLRERFSDHLGPTFDLLGLRAIRVSPHEDVTQVHQGAGELDRFDERRHELARPLAPLVIEREGGVAHSRGRSESGHELVGAGHLRRPLRTDEGARHDGLQTRGRQRVEQT